MYLYVGVYVCFVYNKIALAPETKAKLHMKRDVILSVNKLALLTEEMIGSFNEEGMRCTRIMRMLSSCGHTWFALIGIHTQQDFSGSLETFSHQGQGLRNHLILCISMFQHVISTVALRSI